MHSTPTPESSAARQFWNTQMQRHPNLHGILSILGSVAEFFTGGHFLVRLGHKVVLTGGVIAETSLLFATLWVTADYTIPAFLHRFLSGDLMSTCTSLSQASFSLLPEIILASAIVTTVQHWKQASSNWRSTHWVWASLYSAPTLTFLALTLYTILTFSSQGGSIAQATGAALALRCFAGYSYALLELIYVRIGKPSEPMVSQQDHLKTVETLHAEHEERMATLAGQHQQALATLTEQHERRLGQLDVQQQQHLLTAIQEAQSSAPVIDYEALTEAVTKNIEARIEANSEAGNARQLEAPKKGREAKIPASRGGNEASTNVLTLRQRGAVPTEKRAAVYALLDTDDRLSSYEIAEKTGYPPSTIQRYMKDWKTRQTEAESRAAHEATDTAM
jgi:hypothetical protein